MWTASIRETAAVESQLTVQCEREIDMLLETIRRKTADVSFEAVSYQRLPSVVTPNWNNSVSGFSDAWSVPNGEIEWAYGYWPKTVLTR